MGKGMCSVDGCELPVLARALCNKHYQRWWKRGTLELAAGYEPRTLQERFEAKYQRSDGCWVWTGARDANGYGKFSVVAPPESGSTRRHWMANAHRISYELYVGPIPAELQIDHLCRNRLCVNPRHLEPVTMRVNVLRGEGVGAKCSRRTHCKHGHEYTKQTTRLGPAGNRICRACEKERSRKRRSDDPEAARQRDRLRKRKRPKGR